MSETLTNQLSADFLILRIKQLEAEVEALKEESFQYYRRLCEVTVERDRAQDIRRDCGNSD